MKKTACFFVFFIAVLSCALRAGEMTWQECVDEAIVNSPSLASARAKLDQARANSWLATAGALPQVSVSADGSRQGTEYAPGTVNYVGGVPVPAINSTGDSYSYGATASQLVFDFFKTLQDMESAGETERAAEMDYIMASATVRYNLMQAYAGLMKAQQLISITDAILTLRKQQVLEIRQMYLAGQENKGSLMSLEADLKEAEFEKDQAVRDLDLAKLTFAGALGRDKSGDIALKADFTAPTDPRQEPDFEKLFKTNPGLLMLIAQKNAAANAAGSAISAFFPSVYVNGSANRSANTFPPQNTNWSVGVGVSLPLLDGGRLIAQSDAAQGSLRQAEADLKNGELNTMIQLKNAWNGYKDSAGSLDSQKSALDANVMRAKIADMQYKTGIITFDDWTIIQDGLVSAQKSYLSAEANLLTSEAAWIQAKGGTLEDEKVKPQ